MLRNAEVKIGRCLTDRAAACLSSNCVLEGLGCLACGPRKARLRYWSAAWYTASDQRVRHAVTNAEFSIFSGGNAR